MRYWHQSPVTAGDCWPSLMSPVVSSLSVVMTVMNVSWEWSDNLAKVFFSQVEHIQISVYWFWSDNVIAFDVTRQSVPLKSLSIYSIYSMPVIIFKTVNPSPRPILTVSSKENQRHSCYKWMTYFYLQYGLKGNTQPFETDTYNTSHI